MKYFNYVRAVNLALISNNYLKMYCIKIIIIIRINPANANFNTDSV